MAGGSSAALRRLGAELRRLREVSGRTQVDVGAAIDRSHATLVNWERGKTKISKSDLVCLLGELRAPADVRRSLDQLRIEATRGGSEWAVYGLPEPLRPLLSFEQDAAEIVTFEPVIVPGLLQTEDYARETHVRAPYVVAPEVTDRWVAARMLRQQRLTEKRPLRLHAVIAEAALRLQVSSSEVLVAQLEHLIKATQMKNVTIQIIPATNGAHSGIASNLTVLHFPNPDVDPPLGYFDGPLGGYLVHDPGDVVAMINMCSDLRETALDQSESAALLAAILEEQQPKGGIHVRTDPGDLA